MTVRIKSQTQIKSQTLVGFPPQPALNLNFTQGYANGLNPLPSTVTFTRNDAGAYATQVGPDGLVRLAAHNILVQSQDLTSGSWTKVASSATIGGTAPDGTQTANMFMEAATTNFHYTLNTASVTAGQTYTYSAYLKNNGSRHVALYSNFILGSSDVNCIFDLATGLFNNLNNTSCTASMVYVGNGWYRCNITGSALTSSSRNFGVTLTNSFTAVNSYLGVATNGAYVWGAQLEQNLTPSYYVPTTTAAKYADTPRFDYSPVTTEPLGLLIEESRQNVAKYGNTLETTGGSWTSVASGAANTITLNSITGPDGVTNSASLITYNTAATGAGTYSLWRYNLSSTANGTYTFSVWLRAGTNTSVYLRFNDSSGNRANTLCNLTTAWQRFTVTGTTAASITALSADIGADGNVGGQTMTTGTIYAWGAQLEAGSFPTSYIPTTSGPVTRAAESATMTGTNFSSWWNNSTGTFLARALSTNTSASDARIFSTYDGGATRAQDLYKKSGGQTISSYSSYTGYGSQDFYTVAINVPFSAAIAYEANNCNAAVNGTAGTTDTSVTINVTPVTLGIGNYSGAGFWNGTIAKLQYWPARFSNAQLQLITKG